jgi:nucleotide-binding universal stress UspA family protein
MRKLMVGFDGSDESRDALLLAKQLAMAEGAELHVAVVLDDGPPVVLWNDISLEEVDPDAERRRIERLFSAARRELGAQRFVQHALRDISAPRALHDLADELGPEMIVLGSTHEGAIGRVVNGSVGAAVLAGAPCTVAVAPRGYVNGEHFGVGVVGVGYDGSPEAELALSAATSLATKLECSLRVIAVVPRLVTPGRIGGTDTGYEAVLAEQLRELLRDAARKVGEGIDVSLVLEHGDAAEALANQGVELDLLVVGSRGYGPLRRVLLGGVSNKLMRLAPCPLLITPRGSERTRRNTMPTTAAAAS